MPFESKNKFKKNTIYEYYAQCDTACDVTQQIVENEKGKHTFELALSPRRTKGLNTNYNC